MTYHVTLRHAGGMLRPVEVLGVQPKYRLLVRWGELSGIYYIDLRASETFPQGVLWTSARTRGIWTPVDREECLKIYYLLSKQAKPGLTRVEPQWQKKRQT